MVLVDATILLIVQKLWTVKKDYFVLLFAEVVVRAPKATNVFSGCGANSFMIRDGVCDEITNVERCLYDGGDCCKEDKSTDLCKVCTCKMVIDTDFLNKRLLETNSTVFEKRQNFHQISVTHKKNISDVASLDACHMICLDDKLDELVNAWSFNKTSGFCNCSWIEAPVCSHDFDLTPINNLSEVDDSGMRWVKVSTFIQLSKVIPCGMAHKL